jgi:hypothetical protein
MEFPWRKTPDYEGKITHQGTTVKYVAFFRGGSDIEDETGYVSRLEDYDVWLLFDPKEYVGGVMVEDQYAGGPFIAWDIDGVESPPRATFGRAVRDLYLNSPVGGW